MLLSGAFSYIVQDDPVPEMTADAAQDLIRRLESAGAPIWIDGGWAADALLGRQTRTHSDLDIAIEGKHVKAARRLLESLGFRDVERDDTREWNFVVGHPDGREVDFHVIELDAAGNGMYGPIENNDSYPAATLSGKGQIGGLPVNCLSPEGLIQFRCAYPHPPRERDFHDVHEVCSHFGIVVPEKFRSQ
jgi:lincosamide nucleotidyltransferase A/C/D/E